MIEKKPSLKDKIKEARIAKEIEKSVPEDTEGVSVKKKSVKK